ncbi:MAG: PEP-CTERM sorting domain-containing protein [Ferribacterium limneticum]
MAMFHDYDDCFHGYEPKSLIRLNDDAMVVKKDNRCDCSYFVFETKKETAVKYRISPLFVTLIAAATLAASGAAQAALNDRGGGLLYDDVLNVTWLQDANYAKTSGYDADGLMNWSQANTWAANLSYYDSVRKVTYDDWHLAANAPVNGTWDHSKPVTTATGTWNYGYSATGTTDYGYNIKSSNSELAFMYYVNLGLKGYYSPTGAYQSGYGVPGTTYGDQADVGLVKNLVKYAYWSGTAYAAYPSNVAWYFDTSNGVQGSNGQSEQLAAWAVRPGDVAAVPEPETYAMLLAGMGLLAGVVKRRRRFGAS